MRTLAYEMAINWPCGTVFLSGLETAQKGFEGVRTRQREGEVKALQTKADALYAFFWKRGKTGGVLKVFHGLA